MAPKVAILFNGQPSGFMEQFITMDPAFAEGSLDLRQKTYLWHAQGELPSERSRLKSLQSDWWWSRDDAAIAASKQRIVRLTSTIENFHDTDIQYKDIHSGDESVAWSGTKGFGNGLKTGAKANVNGLSSAGVGLVTLGYVDGVEVWTVQQDDTDGGYGTALIVARGGGELLLVATPTGLASIAGKAGKLGTAARYGSYAMRGADVATNAHDASESAYRMMSEKDFSFANIAQFATSTMGFAGDYSDLNKVLDKAGYKITFSGVASGAPMQIGQLVPNRTIDRIDVHVGTSKGSQRHLLDFPEAATTPRMLGQNGVSTPSTTVWKGKGKSRIDVENPNPGQRPGQVHYQGNDGSKYLYDPTTNSFPNAPRSVNNLLNDQRFAGSIQKALRQYLGE